MLAESTKDCGRPPAKARLGRIDFLLSLDLPACLRRPLPGTLRADPATVILVTRNLRDAMLLADRIAALGLPGRG
jgi:hypothetical protein